MARTYNDRFASPRDPGSGVGWLVGGLCMLPLWGTPLAGVCFLAASVGCFIKYSHKRRDQKLYRRFHECCAVIGMRERVPVAELARTAGVSAATMRSQLQQIIAKGYFGSGALLDVQQDELVLAPGQTRDKTANWHDLVTELFNTMRRDSLFREPAQEEKPVSGEAEAPAAQGGAKKTYMDELESTLAQFYELNETIRDEGVSQRIDRIGNLTASIFRAVIEKPEREQDVRKFMNYYLPTTMKLLKSYDMLEDQSYQGENIIASRKKIENVLDMLVAAYEKQLDRLFGNDALDIATDIDVLETMIASDGLSEKGRMPMA